MRKWEVAEDYLFDQAALGQAFTSIEMADDLGISGGEASELIQSYLDAQRRHKSNTLFVLSRKGRTSGAVWQIGARTDDARRLTRQEVDDMLHRVEHALARDLTRMGAKNPRIAKLVEAQINAFVANLAALAAALP